MWPLRFALACTAFALTGCYTVLSTPFVAVDAGTDSGGGIPPVPDSTVVPPPPVAEEQVAFERLVVSEGECADWDVPAHPSPDVPGGLGSTVTPVWTHHDDADPYLGGVAFASDGSLRALGPSARTFVRFERDGTVAWQRDVGGESYLYTLAPDGSIFAAPADADYVNRRLVHIGPDGTIVGEMAIEVGRPGYAITHLTAGPHGRVYVSNGTLLALCRAERIEWSLRAQGPSGEPVWLGQNAVDATGASIVPVDGIPRALRVSADATVREWVGRTTFDEVPDPFWTGTWPLVVFGTRAIIVAQLSSGGARYPSLVEPGVDPVALDARVLTMDALGRLLLIDGTRADGWIWERGDGTSIHTVALCRSEHRPLQLEDGGFLCSTRNDDGTGQLVRVTPDATLAFSERMPFPVESISVDVDGRVAFTTDEGVGGAGSVHVMQTTARPAASHWPGGGTATWWARPR